MTRPTEQRTAAVLTGAALSLLFAAPSHAYLDPGTGSIILQSLLAGIAVGIGVLRLYWQRFKSFLARLTGGSHNYNNNDEPEFEQSSDTQTKS
jgi:hypothetical protein